MPFPSAAHRKRAQKQDSASQRKSTLSCSCFVCSMISPNDPPQTVIPLDVSQRQGDRSSLVTHAIRSRTGVAPVASCARFRQMEAHRACLDGTHPPLLILVLEDGSVLKSRREGPRVYGCGWPAIAESTSCASPSRTPSKQAPMSQTKRQGTTHPFEIDTHVPPPPIHTLSQHYIISNS